MKTKNWMGVAVLVPVLATAQTQTQTQTQTQGPIAMEMVAVPAGCYRMGSEAGERHERPVREMCVKAFEIGRTEVTQGQWKAVMGTNPSRFPFADTHPVEMVSWNEAQEFIVRMNRGGRGGYRLPTEVEWEYACRSAGKDETWSGATGAHELSDIAWYNKAEAGNATHPVGTKRPNGIGAHDMSGNVWEWTADQFVTPYGGDKREARYVIRGGSWDSKSNYMRCAIRNRYEADFHDPRIGLRLARDVAQ